jgi:DNA polymerase-3 subunit gamma/tau
LQISPEEQKRAARTAAPFSEEELTRFLQTMLRTFDELGYRQEQRFHFELGLLKLVHLRRLLPVEDVLSSLAGGAARSTSAAAKPAAGPVSVPRPAPVASAPPKPAFSPFEQDKGRRKYEGIQGGMSVSPVVATQPVMVQTEAAVRVAEPIPVAAPQPVLVPPPTPIAEAAPPLPASTADATELQRLVVEALAAAKQGAAADAMGDAEWSVADGEARVQTEVSPTMLPVEAEKIARNVARAASVMKLTLLAGASSATPSAKKPKPARTGSAQAKALEHPMVQQAQKLFDAEIQTVIDLSGDD